MDEKFELVEDFIKYVVDNKATTKDGILYFKALLHAWFFSSEVLEFKRYKSIADDILPKINIWIKSNPNSEIPLIIRGVYYIEKAWEISKYSANPFFKKHSTLFLKNIKKVRDTLELI